MQSPVMHRSPEKMFAIFLRLFRELIRITQVHLQVPYDFSDSCTIGQNDRPVRSYTVRHRPTTFMSHLALYTIPGSYSKVDLMDQ